MPTQEKAGIPGAAPRTRQFVMQYQSPLGLIIAAGSADRLTGLWWEGQRYFGAGLDPEACPADTPLFRQLRCWLDLYFSEQIPGPPPPLALNGTPFQNRVWAALGRIPYGETIRYADLAAALGRPSAARAVGAAVGHNPLSLLLPCHRVVGSGGRLTGYAGGLERKAALLALECRTLHRCP